VIVERSGYRLELSPDGLRARLTSAAGELILRPLAALDTVGARDETLEVLAPRRLGDTRFEIERRSTVWQRALVTLDCGEDSIAVETSVGGRGKLLDAHLLGFRSLIPGRPTGFLPTGSSFESLFSPNPADPGRIERSAGERVAIGVVGDGEPGRGHWFFTPAPLFLALGDVTLGLVAPVDELTFTQLVYEGGDRAFSLRLEYEGHTEVDGEFHVPTIVLRPGIADPYDGLARHRADSSSPEPRDVPSWWSEPIFCGWGAQCGLARVAGRRAPELSTQENYDTFLVHLEAHGVVPGTVVLDDKWQDAYGTNEPDVAKWPDLPAWIASRHERGQRVLLWWKAWDAEGLPAEICITNADGRAVAVDPTNPRTRDTLRDSIHRMLAADGLDADGLKVDFTARTPSGTGLTTHGPAWGIALLHELLATVYRAAKEAKPDALVMTHTPHPSFVDVTDMIRLNDMLRIDDGVPFPPIVPQMRFRADVVRAACPELLIDTDDWCVPNLAEWREYVEAKPSLGVPSLYYSQSLDFTGEELAPRDYDALRRTWEQWRANRH
jgi:hypothetical protein